MGGGSAYHRNHYIYHNGLLRIEISITCEKIRIIEGVEGCAVNQKQVCLGVKACLISQ